MDELIMITKTIMWLLTFQLITIWLFGALYLIVEDLKKK